MDKKTIGQKIKELRKDCHMTQVELAKELGVSVGIVSKWEQGIRGVSDKQKEAICKLFGIDLFELLESSEVEPEKITPRVLKLATRINKLPRANIELLEMMVEGFENKIKEKQNKEVGE